MPARVSETFVLRTYPFREADLIVSFFTRDEGKLRGVRPARAAAEKRVRLGFGAAIPRPHGVLSEGKFGAGQPQTVVS